MRRVALVVARRDGLVLFGKRSDNGRYTLPGGHLEEGEDPLAGARRELLEETGLEPESELKLIDERETNGLKLYTYECTVTGAPTGDSDPDQECGLWVFLDVADGIPKAVAENMQGPKNPDDNVAASIMGLAKGAMARLAPIQAEDRPTPESLEPMRRWQGPAAPADRQAIPRLEGPLRTRALHRLSGATSTRISATGEREFLLHRGMGEDEHEAVTKVPGVINHGTMSSWTPRRDIATSFALGYRRRSLAVPRLTSAWVRESAIQMVPNQTGDVGHPGPPSHRHEYEVIVAPHHNSKFQSSELAKAVLDPGAGYKLSHEFWGENNGRMAVFAHDAHGNEAGRADIDVNPDHLHVAGVLVEPEHRRKGLASAMFAHAEKHAGRPVSLENTVMTQSGKAFTQNRPWAMIKGEDPHPGRVYAALMRLKGRELAESCDEDELDPFTDEDERVLEAVGLMKDGQPVELKKMAPTRMNQLEIDNNEAPLAKHDTPEFQSWFSGSKVATPDGKPLRVYHGTSKDTDFNTFKIGNRGAWFSADPATANEYAIQNDSQGHKFDPATRSYTPINSASRVIPAYLALRNPYKMTPADLEAHKMAPNYQRHQAAHFAQLKAAGHDGVDFGGGTYVAFHPQSIKSAFNAKPTGHKAMNKREHDDEIDRLLMHPNPSERSMALKLHGVTDKHLIRALADEDPAIQKQALHHPDLGHHALLSLMQMPDREHLQHLALQHPRINRAHVEALYHTHKDRPVADKARIMHAISHHGHLDTPLIERMFRDGNGDAVVENLNTPPHVIEQLIEQHQLTPSDPKLKALARRALKHPHAPAHLVEHSFKTGPADVKIAVAQSQHLPEALAQDVLQRGQLPAHDDEALLRTFIVQNPKASSRHLETAARDRNPIVRHEARTRLGRFQKFEQGLNNFLSQLTKAIKPEDFKAIRSALDPAGAALVDHKPELEAHPAQHNGDVAAYKQAILDNPKVVKRTATKAATSNATRKAIYTVPVTHPTHGGARYMVKPYHEKIDKRLQKWQKHPHQGWAEMTNQALYHASGIGHLHQNVHVVEHHMGEGNEAEPALVVKMDADVKPLQSYNHGAKNLSPELKHDARKIAMMDFLSGNLDRHSGNVMLGDVRPSATATASFMASIGHPGAQVPVEEYSKIPHRILAIDHSRSFQYVNNHNFKWQPRRAQPQHLEDSFDNYVHRMLPAPGVTDPYGPKVSTSALKGILGDGRPAHPGDHSWVDDWSPSFDWWGQNSDKIKATMAKRLDQIKDPEVRKHIERNFDARARYLDERANIGIENYGHDWHTQGVPQYRPGEKTDDEAERDRWEREQG